MIVVFAVVAAAVLSAVALADRPATTGIPGTFATINVRISDKGLILNRHASSGVQVIGFRIRNVGKKKHNFIVGDYATNAIAPGQFDDFAVSFDDFGKYAVPLHAQLPSQRSRLHHRQARQLHRHRLIS